MRITKCSCCLYLSCSSVLPTLLLTFWLSFVSYTQTFPCKEVLLMSWLKYVPLFFFISLSTIDWKQSINSSETFRSQTGNLKDDSPRCTCRYLKVLVFRFNTSKCAPGSVIAVSCRKYFLLRKWRKFWKLQHNIVTVTYVNVWSIQKSSKFNILGPRFFILI